MSIINDALKKAEKEKNTADISQIITRPEVNSTRKNYRLWWVILGLGGILGLAYLINPAMFLRQRPAPVPKLSEQEPEPIPISAEPAPEPLPPQEIKPEPKPLPEFTVSGIIYGEGEPWAIIDGNLLKEGDMIKGTRVVKIDKDRVQLVFEGREFTILLRQ